MKIPENNMRNSCPDFAKYRLFQKIDFVVIVDKEWYS